MNNPVTMQWLFVAFLAASPLCAQSTEDLKRKYTGPGFETFTVRPGIGVTIRRTPHGAVAEMLIEPMAPDSLSESRHMTLSRDDVKPVLDELVPMSSRAIM